MDLLSDDAERSEDEFAGDGDSIASDIAPPVHPVPAMQEAFQESIQEAGDAEDEAPKPAPLDVEARRKALLDSETYDPSWAARWKQKPTATCHPITKLMSQIIFGLHLLYQRSAKSDAEVVKILQVHVDEIDAFLEETTEDFTLAVKDIEERIGFLKLPMSHVEVFETMLDDKNFRNQLIEGNDKIERIIERTAKAMNAALLDVQKGVNTTQQLAAYLDGVKNDWPQDTRDQTAIYMAMKGNEEGWRSCLRDLQGKGHQLGVALVQLGTVVGEMSKLAAAASRKNMSSPDIPGMVDVSNLRRKKMDDGSRNGSLEIQNKPLPREPDSVGVAVQAMGSAQMKDSRMRDHGPRNMPSRDGSITQGRIAIDQQRPIQNSYQYPPGNLPLRDAGHPSASQIIPQPSDLLGPILTPGLVGTPQILMPLQNQNVARYPSDQQTQYMQMYQSPPLQQYSQINIPSNMIQPDQGLGRGTNTFNTGDPSAANFSNVLFPPLRPVTPPTSQLPLRIQEQITQPQYSNSPPKAYAWPATQQVGAYPSQMSTMQYPQLNDMGQYNRTDMTPQSSHGNQPFPSGDMKQRAQNQPPSRVPSDPMRSSGGGQNLRISHDQGRSLYETPSMESMRPGHYRILSSEAPELVQNLDPADRTKADSGYATYADRGVQQTPGDNQHRAPSRAGTTDIRVNPAASSTTAAGDAGPSVKTPAHSRAKSLRNMFSRMTHTKDYAKDVSYVSMSPS